MNIYQGQLEEYLKKEEQHKRRSSRDGHTMATAKRDNRHHHESGNSHDDHRSSGKGHHPSHRRAEEESLDERPFPSELVLCTRTEILSSSSNFLILFFWLVSFALDSSASMTERDMKIRATTSPQQVPWANSNESRQEGQNLGGKSVVDMEGKSFKDLNVVSLRGQGNSALPVGNRAANLNTKGHQNDGRARETTNSCRQSHHVDGHDLGATRSSNLGHDNGERVSGYANSRSKSRHMDERVPEAFGVPGLNEDSEGQRHESPGISAHCITARVVDSEEEHRVLCEQLHQALREVRAHEGVAVAHSAAIDGSVEHGNAAADDVDGSVERGKVTVGQAPVINKNLTIQQAPTINMDSSKSGGSWPAENQEEQVPIIPHLNSQECTSNNTKANLSKEIASEKANSKVRTVMSSGRIGVSHVKDAVPAAKSPSEAKEVCREHKPAPTPQYKDHVNDVEASPSVIDGTSLINADNFIQSNDPQSKLPNHDDVNNIDDEDNAPKDAFGAMEGCFRDCHVKHGILYLGNITYLIAWLVSLDSPYFFGSWAALIVWMMLYGLFMIEFFCSSTAKYLRNINVTEDIMDFMQRLYRTSPTLTLRIECYHHEWRTVSYTDSEGTLVVVLGM